MLSSLSAIYELKKGNLNILKNERWLMYLYLTQEANFSYERIDSISKIKTNSVLNYVQRTLEILDGMDMENDSKCIIEEVLKWSEVAKCGLPNIREQWRSREFNLFVHNIGSAQIYCSSYDLTNDKSIDVIAKEIISTLIFTHGLIGQYLRGEVNLIENMP